MSVTFNIDFNPISKALSNDVFIADMKYELIWLVLFASV